MNETLIVGDFSSSQYCSISVADLGKISDMSMQKPSETENEVLLTLSFIDNSEKTFLIRKSIEAKISDTFELEKHNRVGYYSSMLLEKTAGISSVGIPGLIGSAKISSTSESKKPNTFAENAYLLYSPITPETSPYLESLKLFKLPESRYDGNLKSQKLFKIPESRYDGNLKEIKNTERAAISSNTNYNSKSKFVDFQRSESLTIE